MIAFIVDDAQVHIGIGLGMHDLEDLVEVGFVGQVFERVGVGNGEQLGDAFIEKKIQGIALIFDGTSQGFFDFFGIDAVKEGVEEKIDKQQGDNGKADDGQAMLPPEFSIVSFHGAILAPEP
jgi:hypothetical protein